jgi:serine/threonine protein kinase
MHDDDLDPVFSSKSTVVSGLDQIQADAKDLIRWCLQGDPQNRPSMEQILSHRLLQPEGGSIPLAEDGEPSNRMKYRSGQCKSHPDPSVCRCWVHL